jgi:hypothetical protein
MRATARRRRPEGREEPGAAPAADLGVQTIMRLQRQVGNHAVTALLRARMDPGLAPETAAVTEGGEISFNPRVALLEPDRADAIARHEHAHARHQRAAAAIDDSPGARAHAEDVAHRAETGGAISPAELAAPAPSRLTYVGSNYGPFPTVYVGDTMVILEVESGGVPVRTYVDYKQEFGIPNQGAAKFECDPKYRDTPHLQDLAKRMRAVCAEVTKMNALMPANAPERVSLVAIDPGEEPAYRLTASGKGMITLKEPDVDDVAHEASHAIFEAHSGTSRPGGTADNLALNVADLFIQLKGTKQVPIPAGPFDQDKRKPSKTHQTTEAAGLVMVLDVLWAGEGGHTTQDPPTEFFASAFGAFRRNRALLEMIIDYYQTLDPALKALRARLMTLLEAVEDPKKQEALKAPTAAGAAAMIGKVQPAATIQPTSAQLLALLDPAKMRQPASAAACQPTAPAGQKKPKGAFDDVLE